MAKYACLLFCAATMLASGAVAEAPSVESGRYEIEPNHTEVLFAISHLGFTTYYGQFPGASGTLILDGANPAASQLDVSVPVASVLTASPKLNEELKEKGWFDAATFPVMTFHSTKITLTGPTTADVAGDLTLHGKTHPLVLHATFNRAATNLMSFSYTAGFEVTGDLKRSDFGVSKYVPFVGDDVHLIISAAFERKGK